MATLQGHGIQPDEAVGLLAPATPEAIAYLIAATAVATAFPLNSMLAAQGMAAQFALGRVRVVVVHDGDAIPDLHSRVVEAAEQASCVASILPIGQDLNRAAFCAREPQALAAVAPDDARVAALFHTGGTTGDPKLAQLSARNLAAGAHMAAAAIGYRAGDRLLMALPLFHVRGAIDAVLGESPPTQLSSKFCAAGRVDLASLA